MATENVRFRIDAVGNAVPELQKVQNQLGSLDKAMTRTTRGIAAQTKEVHRTRRGMKKLSYGMGQLGLQVQDVAVQASMGTDALRIFSMQGPQIMSIFGPLGMVAGALGGVAAGVLMASGGLQRFSGVFEKIKPALDGFTAALGNLIQQFQPVVSFVQGALAGAFQILGNVIDFVSDNIETLTVIAGTFVAMELGMIVFRIARDFLKFGKAVAATKILLSGLNAVARTSPLMLLAVALGVAADQLGLIAAGMDKLKKEFPDFFAAVGDVTGSTAKLIKDTFSAMNDAFRDPPLMTTVDGIERTNESLDKLISNTKTLRQVTIDNARMAGDAIANSFENAFMSVVDGTMKAKDAFRIMAADIIKELYRIFVVKKITGMIADTVSFALGPKTGNTGSQDLPSFAGGGFTGSGPRSGGIDGKGGFLATLHPNETVVDHANGQSSQPVIVNQTINISTGVQQTVRNEIRNMLPMISESAKGAVLDAKRRGGSYGRAFA